MSAIPDLRRYAKQYADILGCRGVAFAEQGFGTSTGYMALNLVEAALGTRILELHRVGAENWLEDGRAIATSYLRTALERGYIDSPTHSRLKKELATRLTPDGLLNRVANLLEANFRAEYRFKSSALQGVENIHVLHAKLAS